MSRVNWLLQWLWTAIALGSLVMLVYLLSRGEIAITLAWFATGAIIGAAWLYVLFAIVKRLKPQSMWAHMIRLLLIWGAWIIGAAFLTLVEGRGHNEGLCFGTSVVALRLATRAPRDSAIAHPGENQATGRATGDA